MYLVVISFAIFIFKMSLLRHVTQKLILPDLGVEKDVSNN